MREDFFEYYNEELTALRKGSSDFAERFPKSAGRLKLRQGEAEDPFVARLFEGFSFLTARLKYQLDHQHDYIALLLINFIAPHLVQPFPSCGTVELKPSRQLNSIEQVEKGEMLILQGDNKTYAPFQIAQKVQLQPINLADVKYSQKLSALPSSTTNKQIKSFLQFSLTHFDQEKTLCDIGVEKLRIFINLPTKFAHLLYTYCFNHLDSMVIANQEKVIIRPASDIKTMIFDDTSALLPQFRQGINGYQLLSEFHYYPQKFFYLDWINLNEAFQSFASSGLKIYFLFNQAENLFETKIKEDALKLHCTPIINIFKRRGEPIRVNGEKSSYPVVPEGFSQELKPFVYQIQSMNVASGHQQTKLACAPYYGARYGEAKRESIMYWQAVQRPRRFDTGKSSVGYDYHISFNDTDFSELRSNGYVVVPELICSNFEGVQQLLSSAQNISIKFSNDAIDYVDSIELLQPLTQAKQPNLADDQLFKILRYLENHHLFSELSHESVDQLKELLLIHAGESQESRQLIKEGIVAIETEQMISRHPTFPHEGFCHGLRCRLIVNEACFIENELYLFGTMLSELLMQLSVINSFIQLIICNQEKREIFKWNPMIGSKQIC